MIPDGTKVKVVGCQEDFLKQFMGFVGIAHKFGSFYWVCCENLDEYLVLPEEYLEVITNGY